MSVYKCLSLSEILAANTYPGRGIVVGLSEHKKYAVSAYFIMGCSENSRNRVFIEEGDEVIIHPFDASKVEDPSLIIYSPIRKYENKLIVTNGAQTATVYAGLVAGKSFSAALTARCFEPDAPNFTPRISAMLTFCEDAFTYQMSILKSADAEGSACNRFTFDYAPIAGVGHFLHTYNCDGNPIPTFTGEPERIALHGDIDSFTKEIWENLNEQNKISLYVRFTELATGKTENRMINKNV